MKPIVIKSDGYELAGKLFLASNSSDLAFMFIQGWTGNQNVRAAQALCDMGHTCLTYDMRGNGESSGDISLFSRADFCHDAEVVYDYLRSVVGDNVKFCVVGSSFGSYTATILSSSRDVYAMSLRVPANYPDEGFDSPQIAQIADVPGVKEWRGQRLDWHDNAALKAIHAFTGPVQIIQAGADKLVAHQTVENYVRALRNREQASYTIMRNAPHTLSTEALNLEYVQLLTHWVGTIKNLP